MSPFDCALDIAREHLSWAVSQDVSPGQVVAAVQGGPVRALGYSHACLILAQEWLRLDVPPVRGRHLRRVA